MEHSVDPVRTPHSAASDQRLHCLFRPVCPITQGRDSTCMYIMYHYRSICIIGIVIKSNVTYQCVRMCVSNHFDMLNLLIETVLVIVLYQSDRNQTVNPWYPLIYNIQTTRSGKEFISAYRYVNIEKSLT